MNAQYAVISPSDTDYPEGLRDVLPNTTIYAVGDLRLLGKRALSICGSRNASLEALECAYEFGGQAAKQGYVVVSGYARGVDRQAHKGALEAGGATIAVLAEGIHHFRLVRELKHLIGFERNFLAVSMFEPDAVWTTWRAMERNKLIVGLSIGLWVVEARERGGTINAAMQCVRQKKPLWAIAYSQNSVQREGNRKLLEAYAAYAVPIKPVGDIQRALEQALLASPSEEAKQLAFNMP